MNTVLTQKMKSNAIKAVTKDFSTNGLKKSAIIIKGSFIRDAIRKEVTSKFSLRKFLAPSHLSTHKLPYKYQQGNVKTQNLVGKVIFILVEEIPKQDRLLWYGYEHCPLI